MEDFELNLSNEEDYNGAASSPSARGLGPSPLAFGGDTDTTQTSVSPPDLAGLQDIPNSSPPTASPLESAPADSSISSGSSFALEQYLDYSKLLNEYRCYLSLIDQDSEPRSYYEAARYYHWREAMNAELSALERNGTWVVTDLPHGKQAIGCKWVYKVKRKADGLIERYKARLVAKGYTQIEGLDFDETFALVAKL
ncbi:hypothetical protein CRG98_021688 [Punica granatum]|uniref:Reverse transcriptase Ty1/copia-type domain-containing protein n=1 Tax=Punica granatum TaxID=22663 RepID=A0A2I0JPS9_PUNGR|nr:hypothetical protein CRG98_021688 [Punica granatum]